jgi:hypothetical protein
MEAMRDQSVNEKQFATGFVDCPGDSTCSGSHVQWESAEQATMVAECRERAARQREEIAARRRHFRETGVWV